MPKGRDTSDELDQRMELGSYKELFKELVEKSYKE